MLSLDHYVRRRGVAEIHRIWRKRPRFLAVVSLTSAPKRKSSLPFDNHDSMTGIRTIGFARV